MACQGSPTLTQFTTTVSTAFVEHPIVTTQTVSVGGFRKRQDTNDPNGTLSLSATVGPDPTSTTTTDGGFNVNDFSTTVFTFTSTETLLETLTIPTQTLYAPCSATDTGTGSVSASSNSTVTGSASVSGASLSVTDPPKNDIAPGSVMTTTSEGQTLVVSAIVTNINGTQTYTVTPIQTLLNTSDGPLNNSQRAGVIAGSVGGALIILLALLALFFYYRRRRQYQAREAMLKEKARRPPRHLLEAEADDYLDEGFVPPMSQWDALSLTTGTGSSASAPRLLRARGSQTGSLFHENVWPPPTEVIQDPLLTHEDLGSSISLITGIPIDTSSTSQDSQQATRSRPSSDQMPMAISTGEAVGAVGRQQRSSAYDSVRSMDSVYYDDYGRSHSRAESIQPLLDSAAPVGQRTISPPPLALRTTTSPPPSFRPGRTNMRVSYTADDIGSTRPPPFHRTGTSTSAWSAYSISPDAAVPLTAGSGDSGLPASAGSADSELLRDVLQAGSRVDLTTPQEIPPQYHSIRRDIP